MKRTLIFASVFFLSVTRIFIVNVIAQPVPDTGQTTCYDNNWVPAPVIWVPDTDQTKGYDDNWKEGDAINCPFPGQPFYGQDANYNINPMSYTKLGVDGIKLPDDAEHIDHGGPWIMTKDNVTGLIWEVKQNKDGVKNYNNPHDADNRYTWYEPSAPYNVGTPGDGTDTKDFVDALNNSNFGGFKDWRLPTIKELAYIADLGKPYPEIAIDTRYFPNTIRSGYWSSTIDASNKSSAHSLDFVGGSDCIISGSGLVRAVRKGQAESFDHFKNNNDGTVTDTSTGLMWQKTTAPGKYTWEEALAYCESSTLANYADWRLPNIKELRSLVDYSRHEPAINTTYFPDSYYPISWYCSSTSSIYEESYVLGVNFTDGHSGASKKGQYCYVRSVRGGQFISVERVLNWAESILPDLLPVEGRTVYNQDGLYVRYYPDTGIYLGGYQGRLLYYQPGLSPDVCDLGSLDDYLPFAVEAGF